MARLSLRPSGHLGSLSHSHSQLLAILGASHIHIHSFWPSWVSLSLPDGFTFTFTTVPGSARPNMTPHRWLADGLQMTPEDA